MAQGRKQQRAAVHSRAAGWALAVYGVALAVIALWPVPIDSGAHGALDALMRTFPFATYGRIERAANIALFIPLGYLLAVWLRHPWAALPIALVVSAVMEVSQLVLLPARTPTLVDVVTNTAGAFIGWAVAMVARRLWQTARTSAPG